MRQGHDDEFPSLEKEAWRRQFGSPTQHVRNWSSFFFIASPRLMAKFNFMVRPLVICY